MRAASEPRAGGARGQARGVGQVAGAAGGGGRGESGPAEPQGLYPAAVKGPRSRGNTGSPSESTPLLTLSEGAECQCEVVDDRDTSTVCVARKVN